MQDAEAHHAVTCSGIPHDRYRAHHSALAVHRHHCGFTDRIECSTVRQGQVRVVVLRAV